MIMDSKKQKDDELNKLIERCKDLRNNLNKNISEIIEAAKILESKEEKKKKEQTLEENRKLQN